MNKLIRNFGANLQGINGIKRERIKRNKETKAEIVK